MDPAKTRSVAVYKYDGTLLALAADWKALRLYAGGSDSTVYLIDPATEKKEPLAAWRKHENYVAALACLPREDGAWIVSGGYDRRLVWWNAQGEVRRTVDDAHGLWIRDLAPTPDGKLLVSCGDDMRVKVWEAESGAAVQSLRGHAERTPQGFVSALYVVAVSPDGKFLAAGDRVGQVCIWEIGSWQLAQRLEVPVLYTYDPRQRKRSIGGIRSLAFSPDGTQLAVGGIGQIENVDGLAGPATVELWDWRQPRRLATLGLDGHKAIINALQYSSDNAWLVGAGGGSDNAVLGFWKLPVAPSVDSAPDAQKPADKKNERPGAAAAHKFKFDGHVHRLLLQPDGQRLFAAGYKKLEVFALADV